jgi:hypothetical protein
LDVIHIYVAMNFKQKKIRQGAFTSITLQKKEKTIRRLLPKLLPGALTPTTGAAQPSTTSGNCKTTWILAHIAFTETNWLKWEKVLPWTVGERETALWCPFTVNSARPLQPRWCQKQNSTDSKIRPSYSKVELKTK